MDIQARRYSTCRTVHISFLGVAGMGIGIRLVERLLKENPSVEGFLLGDIGGWLKVAGASIGFDSRPDTTLGLLVQN